MKRAIQTWFLIVCGYLGMWLLVSYLICAMIYGTAVNTPDWVFWVGLALALPLHIILCNPKEVLETFDTYEYYKDKYVYYRDLYFGYRADMRDETARIMRENEKLKAELDEAKARKCRKVTVCVRRCGK